MISCVSLVSFTSEAQGKQTTERQKEISRYVTTWLSSPCKNSAPGRSVLSKREGVVTKLSASYEGDHLYKQAVLSTGGSNSTALEMVIKQLFGNAVPAATEICCFPLRNQQEIRRPPSRIKRLSHGGTDITGVCDVQQSPLFRGAQLKLLCASANQPLIYSTDWQLIFFEQRPTAKPCWGGIHKIPNMD